MPEITQEPSPETRRLQGRVAIVTGAGSGIGRAAALAFAREGANVVVAGRRVREIEETAGALEAEGVKALAIPTDVSRSGDIEALIANTVRHFGRLDCAFNNAGIEGVFAPITDLSEEDFDQVIATNLKGVWLAVKHQVAAMLQHGTGGAIVNTSSWLAKGALAGSSVYSASKGALDAMIRAVALEVAERNIRINNVNPGIIDTPMLRRFVNDETAKPWIDFTPAKRLGRPADIGDVAMWLCTDEARFVTGQSLLVDGGYTIAGMR
ncbi:oxidoreductase [Labrys okinawensis]|uniref:Oxidoreductase n=1 Tax=Labrys okinawensis TaxID=346911 RepID=A0A2S9QDI2_9HYPH|nr:glucose 1-dehydrogenase [Labrys okinawensis]PRH87409.1 oxidoreductase [Labrys okinawensis]